MPKNEPLVHLDPLFVIEHSLPHGHVEILLEGPRQLKLPGLIDPRDLNALCETTITHKGQPFAVRSRAVGVVGKITHPVGAQWPWTVRQLEVETPRTEPVP